MKRNNMLSKRYFLGMIVLAMVISSCKGEKRSETENMNSEEVAEVKEPFFKLSLAQMVYS